MENAPVIAKVVSKTSHVREERESMLIDVCRASLALSAQDKERIVSTSVIRGRLEGLQVLAEATPSDDDQDQLPFYGQKTFMTFFVLPYEPKS